MSKFPLHPPSPARRKYLALVFGSTDGTPDGIANTFDRQRYEARVAFERRKADIEIEIACYKDGSPDGTPDSIPDAKHRAALIRDFRNSGQHLQDWHARENQFPALVAGTGMRDFLKPFGVSDNGNDN